MEELFNWISANTWILYLSTAIVAMRAGWKLHEFWMYYLISEHTEEIEELCEVAHKARTLEDNDIDPVRAHRLAKTGIEMSIEQVGNYLHAYSKDTGQFLAQGIDLDALLEECKKRFPNKSFFGYMDEKSSAKVVADKNLS
jgi:hypothetical protein